MSEPEITRREALQLSVDLSDQAEREHRTPYALYVVFELRSQAAAEAFDKLVADALVGIEGETGTLVYTVHTPEGGPLTRVFYELYADRDAFLEHEAQPHTRHMLQAREQYLTSAPKVVFLHQHQGKLPHGPL
ncbi:antibiotic biosynthesis monooxygenase [Streptomyces sp. YC504]|uniref:Antibiotic biosynthesis monooxygenase n=1 Tax=Streptomyces mesophilus TaxID=1775132 RepID=A0A6G4XAR5_9ACTN|nr:antibiotic biosynthesis monooxygenase [Streptomyces mesophilus]NGO74615.1 antibiotic biosynthesis monooxygenase [Streptomyces mesophilus]